MKLQKLLSLNRRYNAQPIIAIASRQPNSIFGNISTICCHLCRVFLFIFDFFGRKSSCAMVHWCRFYEIHLVWQHASKHKETNSSCIGERQNGRNCRQTPQKKLHWKSMSKKKQNENKNGNLCRRERKKHWR